MGNFGQVWASKDNQGQVRTRQTTGKRTNATGKRRKNQLVSEKKEKEEEEEEKVGSRIRRRLSAN